MASIKSYTDLEQSKKLADVLPLESADMYYPWYIEEDGDTIESGHRITTPNVGNFTTHKVNKMILPCWSLSALISVIPNYKLSSEHNHHTCTSETPFGKETVAWFDNPVDACYELILKLKEKNLL